jgi:hypothetical protein
MTWRWRLRPVLGALAVVLACAAAGRADGALVPTRVLGDHLVSDVASVHAAQATAAARRSWHSPRSSLGCALRASQEP